MFELLYQIRKKNNSVFVYMQFISVFVLIKKKINYDLEHKYWVAI